MTVSSAPVPSIVPGGVPTAAPAAGSTESVPSGAFASLLPANPGVNPDASATADDDLTAGANGGEPDDLGADPETEDGTELTLAQQTNLAALLYTRPATVPPPPAPLTAEPAATPASISDVSQLNGRAMPQSSGSGDEGGASVPNTAIPNAAISNTAVPNTAVPNQPAPSGGSDESKQGRPKYQGASSVPLNASSPAMNAPAPVKTALNVQPADKSPALSLVGQDQTRLPAATNGPVTKSSEPGTEVKSAAVPVMATPSVPNRPANDEAKPLPAAAAEIAPPPSAAKNAPETSAANSAQTGPVTTASESAALISQLPTDTDISSSSEPNTPGKKLRGTDGAKPLRDMIDTPHPNSTPGTHSARTAAPGLATPATGLDNESSKGASGDAQDLMSKGGTDANQPATESFSVTTASSLTPQTARSEATVKAMETKPMSPAAVVDQVGLELERIQQRGHDRVDLRLSLEGGGEVSIQLQVRDGAVHASFHTASPELREALQQGWSQLAGRSENQAVPLAPPVFKAPNTGSDSAGQQNFRERGQDAPQDQQQQRATALYAAPHLSKRAGQIAAPTRRTTSGLSTWA